MFRDDQPNRWVGQSTNRHPGGLRKSKIFGRPEAQLLVTERAKHARRTRTLTRAELSSAHQKSKISGDDASTAVSNANEERSESREPSVLRAFYQYHTQRCIYTLRLRTQFPNILPDVVVHPSLIPVLASQPIQLAADVGAVLHCFLVRARNGLRETDRLTSNPP